MHQECQRVSEQPINSQYNIPQREGARFEDSPEGVQVDFHRNNTVPNYDPKVIAAGRMVFEAYSQTPETKPSRVAIASQQLSRLQIERIERMRPEDTPFLKEAA
jgi:hypothetical protein